MSCNRIPVVTFGRRNKMSCNRIPVVTLLLLAFSCSAFSEDKIIHRQKSLYRNIVVQESGNQRCLIFAVKIGDRNQTCMDMNAPKKIVFPYVRMTFAGLLVNPEPRSILVIGLGGGTIPTVLAELFSEVPMDVVEIDPAVVEVARQFFDYKERTGVTVHVQDARIYIKRAVLLQKQYDMIILDAFTGDYIPEHLMTMEFLQETRTLLTESGVLVANTFSTSDLYDHESVTYDAVFEEFINFKMPGSMNRVIITARNSLPSRRVLRDRAKQIASRLDTYSIPITNYIPYLSKRKDWRKNSRPLTDQFSPANLLQGKQTP